MKHSGINGVYYVFFEGWCGMQGGKYTYSVAMKDRMGSDRIVRANSYCEAVSVYCHQPMKVEECLSINPNAKYIVKGERKTKYFNVLESKKPARTTDLVDYNKVKVGDVLYMRTDSVLDPVSKKVTVIGKEMMLGELTIAVLDETYIISHIPESFKMLYWN